MSILRLKKMEKFIETHKKKRKKEEEKRNSISMLWRKKIVKIIYEYKALIKEEHTISM